jgi:hypothetical protein
MSDIIFYGGGAFAVLMLLARIFQNHDDKYTESNDCTDNLKASAKPKTPMFFGLKSWFRTINHFLKR